jgi:hypothetical protein
MKAKASQNTAKYAICVKPGKINLLTPELNSSAQRCLKRYFTGILLLEPCISITYAWKTNKYANY